MRKRELEKFRKLLTIERQQIVEHLSELEGVSNSQLTQNSGDSADIASIETTQASIQKLGNREKRLIAKIDLALVKIDKGDYGVCERCGDQIAVARLEARPVAQYCIDCKTELEQNERRYSDVDEEAENSWESGKFGDSSS